MNNRVEVKEKIVFNKTNSIFCNVLIINLYFVARCSFTKNDPVCRQEGKQEQAD